MLWFGSRLALIYFVLLVHSLELLRPVTSQEDCQAQEDGTCVVSADTDTDSGRLTNDVVREVSGEFCEHDRMWVESSSSGNDHLYRHGGSAQAYKPNVPVSSTVCSSQVSKESKYKVSSWPLTRRTSRKGSAPTMHVTLQLWSCRNSDTSNSSSTPKTSCKCNPLEDVEGQTTIEVWQTRPDGRYSPLKGNDDDCRATVPVSPNGSAKFVTVAPGSTGIMGGLGPRGWESSPYGSPVLHTLIRAPHHAPILLDIPALPHHKTLQERKFSMSGLDWRGIAWSRYTQSDVPYNISSWVANKDRKQIDITVDIFLPLVKKDVTPRVDFCPSPLYLLPSSFFLEPISMCARSLLDFFEL